VTPSGERVSLVVVHIRSVLTEQAGVDAPVVAAHTAAQPELIVELESINDRGAFHERDESATGQLLERVRGLVLTDADIGGVDVFAVILDIGVLDVDPAVGEVSLKLVVPAPKEAALDAEARGTQLDRVVVLVEVVVITERTTVHHEATDHVHRPAAVLAREGRSGRPFDLEIGRLLPDLLRRLDCCRRLLAGLARLLGGSLGLARERVHLARQLLDLALLPADDAHQLFVALGTDVACRKGGGDEDRRTHREVQRPSLTDHGTPSIFLPRTWQATSIVA
jgi:hypothetical protein